MTDEEFIARFGDASLPHGAFHHADHVRMAFLYLRRHPALEARQRFSAALARFAAAHGRPGLYNETITWAFLFLIRERMARAERQQTWREFTAANADLLNYQNNILKNCYRGETLTSDLAKRTFLFPDKAFAPPMNLPRIASPTTPAPVETHNAHCMVSPPRNTGRHRLGAPRVVIARGAFHPNQPPP